MRFRGVTAGLLGGLLITSGLLSSPAYAVVDPTTESITLSPVSKRYSADAGSSLSDSFKIINDGAIAYTFIVYARPYAIINSDYLNPNYGDAASRVVNADAYKWVQFARSSYYLEPGQSVDVPYTVRVPAGATPGGHYGVLFAETQGAAGDGAAIARNKRVGEVLYATVNGAYSKGVEVAQASTSFIQLLPPMTASTSVKNTGNSDFLATVSFKVSDIFGNQKYFEQKDYPVLPDSTRAITMQWAESPRFGLFQTEVRTKALDKDIYTKSYVLMAPFWFYGIVALMAVGGVIYALTRRR